MAKQAQLRIKEAYLQLKKERGGDLSYRDLAILMLRAQRKKVTEQSITAIRGNIPSFLTPTYNPRFKTLVLLAKALDVKVKDLIVED